MFRQIGAVLVGAPAERDRTPVRRHSRAIGRCESVFWRRTNREEVRTILLAAKRYELAGRQPGERTGPLGSIAIELLELFVNLVDFRTGRLDPSIETMMGKLRRSRDAIVRALKNLRTHGFLDWLRRYEPTGALGRGPQVKQTSNAYRMALPAKARQLLGRWGEAPPPPEDHEQRQVDHVAAIEAHKATLPNDELALFTLGDTPLGRALARLGKSIKERESVGQTESLSHSLISMRT